MLTKKQKEQHIESGADLTKQSKALVFADFAGVGVGDLNQFKKELKALDAQFKVFKKRLLKLSLQRVGVDFDPLKFEAQVGTVFAPNELQSVAAPVYKLSKGLSKKGKNFNVLGAYDLVENLFLDADQFTAFAKLPPREVLLVQLLGVLSGPIKAFMYIVDGLSKRESGEENKETTVDQLTN